MPASSNPSQTDSSAATPTSSTSNEEKTRLWTRVGDTEYDITDWIDKHPGGRKLVLLAVNQDATELLHSYHLRLPHVETILHKFPNKPSKEIPIRRTNLSMTFHRELQEEALSYFKSTGQASRGGLEVVLRLLFWFVTGILLNYLVIWKSSYLAAPFLGCWLASMGLAVQHDANHGSLFQSPRLNSFFGLFDDLIGGSSLVWRHHHDVGHHLFTNDIQCDPDSSAGIPFLRMHPSNPWKWYHQFQQWYFPLIASFLGIAYPFADISSFLSRRFSDVKFHPLSFYDNLEFWLGKFVNFGIYLIFPFYFHGISFLPAFLMYQMVGGLYLAVTFAVSHNVIEIDQNGGNQAKDWAELQIIQSTNWSTSSWIANFLTGGLNTQIEHHLFPGVGSRHYRALASIVEKKNVKKEILLI